MKKSKKETLEIVTNVIGFVNPGAISEDNYGYILTFDQPDHRDKSRYLTFNHLRSISDQLGTTNINVWHSDSYGVECSCGHGEDFRIADLVLEIKWTECKS